MNKFKQGVLWFGIKLILILFFLSIYGAFIGAGRAQKFFNSTPLEVYWVVFGVVLILSFAVFGRLIRVPGLLLIHAGCVIVLLGGIWGSQTGHELQKKYLGIDKIREGLMAIYEGQSDNRVVLEDSRLVKELPFSIKLVDFRLEFYEPGTIIVQADQSKFWRLPAKVGTEYDLGKEYGTVKILRKFENFKITIEGEKRTATDNPQTGYNPALEVQFTSPDGQVSKQYVFELMPGHTFEGDKFVLSYQRAIREYISELEVIRDNKVVARKNIEVNHPLNYGGYDFYQQNYDQEAGRFTVLKVVSNTGVNVVFAGYWMLCVGLFWHMWFRRKVKKQKAELEINGT